MIQSILFFVLGFFSAAFLALMVAPAIWRRAVALTRKRIEATVPMTLNEIQAEKDRMRAEFAMSARRLEMSLQSAQEKATGQTVEINRQREELKLLSEECSAKSKTIGELEALTSNVRAEIRKRDDDLRKLEERLADAEGRLEERAAEVEKLERLVEEANFAASNRQIELVARETEVDKLAGDINILRIQQREAEKRNRELTAEMKAMHETLRVERKRAGEAERRLAKIIGSPSGGEERLTRREKDISQVREEANDLRLKLADAEEERDRLQAEIAELRNGARGAAAGANGGESEEQTRERVRLEERLSALVRENKKLRAELGASAQAKSNDGDGVLRAQIQGLAAEVVHLTAALEGPGSPIAKALARSDEGGAAGNGTTSLADRIRALQRSAPVDESLLPG